MLPLILHLSNYRVSLELPALAGAQKMVLFVLSSATFNPLPPSDDPSWHCKWSTSMFRREKAINETI
jgi:hypothetical protein